jgi:protoporphyrin/coproporphyrin ferrochelatase
MIGVLVMAHGTPARPEDIEGFYTRIRRGRPPSSEDLAELERRYAVIGGLSPFAERTAAQVEGIRAALDPAQFVVALGQKHAAPEIEDAVQSLVEAGAERIVGIVLAPHDSPATTDYVARAEAAVDGRVPLAVVRSWHTEPALIDALAARVREVWIDGALLVVTAHSVPLAAVGDDTSYGDALEKTARLVAEGADVTNFAVAWQSAGLSGGRWLDPSLLDVIREEAGAGTPAVVVCPAGFTSEHLEVVYDLDVEAASLASELGIGFARTRSLDDDPAFCALIADLVSRA